MFRVDSNLISGRTERLLREGVSWLAVDNPLISATPGYSQTTLSPFWPGPGGRELGDILKPFFGAWPKRSYYRRGSEHFRRFVVDAEEDMVALDAKHNEE